MESSYGTAISIFCMENTRVSSYADIAYKMVISTSYVMFGIILCIRRLCYTYSGNLGRCYNL